MQDAYENETYRKLRSSSVEGYIYRLLLDSRLNID